MENPIGGHIIVFYQKTHFMGEPPDGDFSNELSTTTFTPFFSDLEPPDDEVEEEGDDGEEVDDVHGAHEELQLSRRA